MSFNERGFFNFEHLRVKEDSNPNNLVENKDEPEPTDETPHAEKDLEDMREVETGSAQEAEPTKEEAIDLGLWEERFKGHTDPKKNGPSAIGLDVSFRGFEHVYGIPQHATSLSLKSTDGKEEGSYQEPYRLYNLDVFEYEVDNPMALYGSVPFMVGHKLGTSAGLFWLNSAEMWVDVAKEKSESNQSSHTHWISESGLVDLFVFVGDEPKQILKQYGDLTGFTALPPIFALGYHQCRWNYINDKDVLAVDAGFDEHDIPYDVLWLDIEHTDGKKYFTWDPVKFPDPKKMQDELASRDRKMVAIVDPHIKKDYDYYIFKEATDLGYFVKDANNEDYEGWCWPGSSSWVDYTRKEACDWWSDQFQLTKYQGSTENLYIWNDMNEPSVFNGPEITMQKDRLHYGGWEHREVHNMFGMLFHKATSDGLVKRLAPNRRPFVLSRAFFPGTQRIGAIWTGDNAASWEHLEVATPMLLSIGLTGISFSGADVGGFFGNPEPELLVRWYQAGAFQPFFRGHAHIDTKRREPWLFGEPYTSQIRQAIRNRYALLPYWYTLFFHSSINGTPAMRPMFLEFPDDAASFAIDNQFMVGPSLLVKPITKPGTESVDVYLPGTQGWFNYFTYEAIKPELSSLTVATPPDYIPVFLRGGSIVPRSDRIRRSATTMQNDPITLLVGLDSKGEAEGEIYLDDGSSYDYLSQGGYHYRQLKFTNNRLTNQPMAPETYSITNPLTFKPNYLTTTTEALNEKLDKVRIERITVLGLTQSPTKVVCEKCGRTVEFTFCPDSHVLTVKDPKLTAITDWSLAFHYD